MHTIDLASQGIRDLNQLLHQSETTEDIIVNNPGGRHSVAVGAMVPVTVNVNGHVGYYCAGMNAEAEIVVDGNAGPGLAENMMSGTVRVSGDASQYCAATSHGGLIVIEGNAAARCGISMKGSDIVVGGSVGHMSAFMAHGSVASTGADCVEKEMRDEHLQELDELLQAAKIAGCNAKDFRRYGSARSLYHFSIDNANAY